MTLPALGRALVASLAIALATTRPARAQQIDVHGTYIHGRGEQRPLSGVGAGVRLMFPTPFDLYLGTRLGVEYAREHGLGPGRSAAALDLTLTPGADLRFVPYVGGSISANRSGGQQPAWKGTRTGFDALVGAIFPTSRIGLQLEARYGYIAELPRVFAARAGLIVDF